MRGAEAEAQQLSIVGTGLATPGQLPADLGWPAGEAALPVQVEWHPAKRGQSCEGPSGETIAVLLHTRGCNNIHILDRCGDRYNHQWSHQSV